MVEMLKFSADNVPKRIPNKNILPGKMQIVINLYIRTDRMELCYGNTLIR